MLGGGIDCQQPQVRSALLAPLDVYATLEQMLTFRQQERSGIEEVQDTRRVDTILVYEKLLSLAKGRVDNLRDPSASSGSAIRNLTDWFKRVL